MDHNAPIAARWRYYVDRPFQNHMLLRFALVVAMVVAIALLGLWLVHENSAVLLPEGEGALFALNEEAAADGSPQMCVLPGGEELPAIRPGRSYNAFQLYWRPMAAVSVATLIAVLAFAFFYSHSVAGPMISIKRSLRRIIDSGEAEPIRIRKGDKFQELVELLNELIEKRVK
ncbi:MAG: hypothetical protein K1X75_10835 [Leptospirales bacterium]|nr:hypothetical protein [Leptospirales bacterium]